MTETGSSRFGRIRPNAKTFAAAGPFLAWWRLAALIVSLFFLVVQVSCSMEPALRNGNVIVLAKTKDAQSGESVGLRLDGIIL